MIDKKEISLNRINKYFEDNKIDGYEVIEVDTLTKPITLRHSCSHTYEIYNWCTFTQGCGRCPECRKKERKEEIKKASLDKINKYFKNNNIEDYEVIEVDALSKPITLRHSCSHTYEIYNWHTFEQGYGRCPECRKEEIKKETLNRINKHLEDNNLMDYEVIEFDTVSKPITLRHSCDHTYEICNWQTFTQGIGRCPECKKKERKEERKKASLNRINKYFKNNKIEDYEVIEFDTLTNPITLRHSCGHIYEICYWQTFTQGIGRCPECRKKETKLINDIRIKEKEEAKLRWKREKEELKRLKTNYKQKEC